MNSTVGPIFNEKAAEKWYLWDHEQCCGIHWCDKSDEKVEKCGYCSWTVAAVPCCCWPKKKRKKKRENTTKNADVRFIGFHWK